MHQHTQNKKRIKNLRRKQKLVTKITHSSSSIFPLAPRSSLLSRKSESFRREVFFLLEGARELGAKVDSAREGETALFGVENYNSTKAIEVNRSRERERKGDVR